MCLTQILLGRIYFALREMATTPVLGGPTFASTTSEATRYGTGEPSVKKGVSFLRIGSRGKRNTSRGNRPRRDDPLVDVTHISLTDLSTLEIRAAPHHRTINVGEQVDPDGRTSSRVSGYGDDLPRKARPTSDPSSIAGSISTLGSVVFVGRGLTQHPSLPPDHSSSTNHSIDSFAFPTPPSVRSDDDVEQLGARRTPSPHPPSLQARRNRSPSPLIIDSTPLTSFPPKSPRRDPRPRTNSVLTSFPPIDATNLSPPNSSRIVSPRLAPSPLSAAPLLPHPYVRTTSPRQRGGGHRKSPSEPWAVPRDVRLFLCVLLLCPSDPDHYSGSPGRPPSSRPRPHPSSSSRTSLAGKKSRSTSQQRRSKTSKSRRKCASRRREGEGCRSPQARSRCRRLSTRPSWIRARGGTKSPQSLVYSLPSYRTNILMSPRLSQLQRRITSKYLDSACQTFKLSCRAGAQGRREADKVGPF